MKKKNRHEYTISRRRFLQWSAACTAPSFLLTGNTVKAETRAHFVILGGGTAGLAISAYLSRTLRSARITLVEPNEEHDFQPGWSLIMSGVYGIDDVKSLTQRHVPLGVRWIRDWATEIDPANNVVYTADRRTLHYDFLIVATGCVSRFDAIEGLHPQLLGQHGITSVYGGAQNAQQTYRMLHQHREGKSENFLFTAPDTPIKCLGVPPKTALMADHLLRRQRIRKNMQLHLFCAAPEILPSKHFSSVVEQHLEQRDIGVSYQYNLKAIDPGYHQAYLSTPDGGIESFSYDLLHVTPPMYAPWVIANSDLSWSDGPYAKGGWLHVDPYTLQHPRYTNVFGIGDVVGTPLGKTVSTIRHHIHTVAENILAVLHDREPMPLFNGYTSCPVFTEVGRALRVAFDYSLQETPDPFITSASTDTRIAWWQQVYFFRLMYNNILRGRLM